MTGGENLNPSQFRLKDVLPSRVDRIRYTLLRVMATAWESDYGTAASPYMEKSANFLIKHGAPQTEAATDFLAALRAASNLEGETGLDAPSSGRRPEKIVAGTPPEVLAAEDLVKYHWALVGSGFNTEAPTVKALDARKDEWKLKFSDDQIVKAIARADGLIRFETELGEANDG